MNERAKLSQVIVQTIEKFPKVHRFLVSGDTGCHPQHLVDTITDKILANKGTGETLRESILTGMAAQLKAELTEAQEEVERLRGFEAKRAELLPKLETLRHYLFRVDRQLSNLDEAGMIERPELVIEYASAFLSVMEFYLPSAEEKALEAQELTRLERLGQELNQAGAELKEEVKREFASLKAQVDTEIGRLESENKRLRAENEQLKQDINRMVY
jgi:chromosome segregation ATPase